MSFESRPADVDDMRANVHPLPFLGEWWMPLDPRSPFFSPDAVLKGGFDGKRRYLGVRAEERDGVAGWIVKQDPDFMNCRTCGMSFDMRQLDQVAAHEHDGLREATGIIGERVQ